MKHNLTGSLLAVLIIAGTTGCRKEDYRDPYLGKYDFTTIATEFSMGDSTLQVDTLRYFGEIAAGGQDSTLSIFYLPDVVLEARLSEDGGLSKSGHFGGRFLSASEVEFGIQTEGLGEGTRHQVHGVKKEEGH